MQLLPRPKMLLPATCVFLSALTQPRSALHICPTDKAACSSLRQCDLHCWQVEVCREQVDWANREKRTFLRQRIEARLAGLYLGAKDYTAALSIISRLLTEVLLGAPLCRRRTEAYILTARALWPDVVHPAGCLPMSSPATSSSSKSGSRLAQALPRPDLEVTTVTTCSAMGQPATEPCLLSRHLPQCCDVPRAPAVDCPPDSDACLHGPRCQHLHS